MLNNFKYVFILLRYFFIYEYCWEITFIYHISAKSSYFKYSLIYLPPNIKVFLSQNFNVSSYKNRKFGTWLLNVWWFSNKPETAGAHCNEPQKYQSAWQIIGRFNINLQLQRPRIVSQPYNFVYSFNIDEHTLMEFSTDINLICWKYHIIKNSDRMCSNLANDIICIANYSPSYAASKSALYWCRLCPFTPLLFVTVFKPERSP